MEPARTRLGSFLAWRGWSQSKAAEALGCSQVFVSYLLKGERLPGRDVACAIEALTADWPQGPIRAVDWSPGRNQEPTGTDD